MWMFSGITWIISSRIKKESIASVIKEKHNCDLCAVTQQRKEGCTFKHQHKMGNIKSWSQLQVLSLWEDQGDTFLHLFPCINCTCSVMVALVLRCAPTPMARCGSCCALCFSLVSDTDTWRDAQRILQISSSGWLKSSACICRVPKEWAISSIFTTTRQFLFLFLHVMNLSHCELIKLEGYILNKELW